MRTKIKTVGLFASAAGLLILSLALGHAKGPSRTPVEDKAAVTTTARRAEDERRIQIALLLDTSSSMDGLIEQAKSQLWKIVNELAEAKRDGARPKLEIALYEYGKSTLSSESGYIRRILAFTTDLDRVSEELFALTTNGGDELCGQVIETATRELSWSASRDDLKLIFIAGNEPFDQGRVDPKSAISAAAAKGIRVNTIYCGEGVDEGWKAGAALADGRFMTIDQNHKVVHVTAPQDAEIARLGLLINETYIPFGALGRESQARQAAQDQNASAVAQGALLQRSISKASAYYQNDGWDLVDATKNKKVDLSKVDEDSLPPELRNKSPEERRRIIEERGKQREKIQAQIQKLDDDRKKFVAEEMKKRAAEGAETLDLAMIRAVRDQATKSGFAFEPSAR